MAADRLAAQQWEIHLARDAIAAGASAWAGPVVMSYRAWSRELWSLRHDTDAPDLLAPRQSHALWRRVIAESVEGSSLISVDGVAEWAEDARRRLIGWRVDASQHEAGPHQQDFAAFLRWCAAYEECLRSGGWIDDPQLDVALAGMHSWTASRICLAEPAELSPSQERVVARLAHLGWQVDTIRPPALDGLARRVQCADERDEIRAAVGWALRRLHSAGAGRVAIVVSGLAERAPEIRRVLRAELAVARAELAAAGDVGRVFEEPFIAAEADGGVDSRALIGAAVNAIEMLSPRGTFTSFSRWLRSPFFQGRHAAARSRIARVEARLRLEIMAQLPFVEAFRRGGLRERLTADLPDIAAALDAALAELGSTAKARSPAHWARLWPQVLHRLGWHGWQVGNEASCLREQRLWEKALADLALLTPIVGGMSVSRALTELETGLRKSTPSALPLDGLHVFTDADDVGPGYLGAWVTGCTDTALPRAMQLNPLLPRSMQVAHGMPWSSPQDALSRSRKLLSRLLERVPDCVFSWPAREHDQPSEPSPLIRGFPVLERDHGDAHNGRQRAPESSGRRKVTIPDPAPPLSARTIRGGTATLDAQARCPIRAFCQYRLGARPLERVERGVPLRLQGLVLHGALERMYRRLDSRAKLEASGAEARHEWARHCVEEALNQAFGAAKPALAVLFKLESERLTTLLERFARLELERPPFRVAAVEEQHGIELQGRLIRTRIDRIDELADGRVAIIDYKSGRRVKPAGWFTRRLTDSQLPLYSIALGPRVAAVVVATVRTDGVAYGGVWQSSAKEFPNRPHKLDDGVSLLEQVDRWRDAIASLVDEYAAGDTRFFVENVEDAQGAMAPLSRVYEQLALHRGWLDRWGSG